MRVDRSLTHDAGHRIAGVFRVGLLIFFSRRALAQPAPRPGDVA